MPANRFGHGNITIRQQARSYTKVFVTLAPLDQFWNNSASFSPGETRSFLRYRGVNGSMYRDSGR